MEKITFDLKKGKKLYEQPLNRQVIKCLSCLKTGGKEMIQETWEELLNNDDFISYLGDKHAEHYMGTDDDMPDAFNNWIGQLDKDEVEDYYKSFELNNVKD